MLIKFPEMPATILELLKVLGPLLLAKVVAIATQQFQKWQVRLAKQKLRHDLYDRRLAIYVAFQELLRKSDDDLTMFGARTPIGPPCRLTASPR